MTPKSASVERFLAFYNSPRTIESYRRNLRYFLMSACDSRDLALYDSYLADLKAGKRSLERDVEDYYTKIKHKAPNTIMMSLAIVKSFMAENNVELPSRFWRRLRARKKGGTITYDQPPTREELKSILSYMAVHGKAAVLMLISGGFRLGELLELRIADVDLTRDPAKVVISGSRTKTGRGRVTFISKEAKEAVVLWLRVKDEYFRASAKRSWKYPKVAGQDRLFPFARSVIYSMYSNALRKAGLDERDATTKFRVRHIHTLRKYFRTKLAGALKNPDVAEAFMGHESGIEAVYRRYTEEDLARFYAEGEHALTVFTDAAELHKLQEKVQEQGKQTTEILTNMIVENQAMKAKMRELVEKWEKVEKIITKGKI